MKNGITELVMILDESGSMAGMTEDTIGGYNSMLAQQKEGEGKVYVSTVLFSNDTRVLHDRVDIEKIEPLTHRDYVPHGCTALLDALGGAIHHIVNIHRYARPEDVPEHTVFIITTDGMENASSRYTADEVRAMVKKEQEKYGWEFMFLAANIDAVETAERYGIRPDRAANYKYSKRGTRSLYECASDAVSCKRRGAELSQEVFALLNIDDDEELPI